MKENRNAGPLQWAEEPLENLLIPRRELVTPSATGENRYVGLEHLDSGLARIYRFGSDSMVRSSKARFYTGDLLYGKLRPYLDKGAIAEWPGVCSTDILVFEVNKAKADPLFMGFFIHQNEFVEYAVANTDGVNHPRTSWSSLSKYRQKIPTIREQMVIARLLSRIQAAIEIQDKSISTLKELKAATMSKLFREGAKNKPLKQTAIGQIPDDWLVMPLGKHLVVSQYGLSIRGEQTGNVPILRMNCQEDGRVVFRDLQYVSIDKKMTDDYRLLPGDLLFNRTNSFEHVGRTAIFNSPNEAVFASYLVRLRVDEKVNPRFLNFYLGQKHVQSEIKTLATKAVGQANISASKLKTFLVPVSTDIGEQEEIAEIIDSITCRIIKAQERKYCLKSLFTAALEKLMSGELRVDEFVESRYKEASSV